MSGWGVGSARTLCWVLYSDEVRLCVVPLGRGSSAQSHSAFSGSGHQGWGSTRTPGAEVLAAAWADLLPPCRQAPSCLHWCCLFWAFGDTPVEVESGLSFSTAGLGPGFLGLLSQLICFQSFIVSVSSKFFFPLFKKFVLVFIFRMRNFSHRF